MYIHIGIVESCTGHICINNPLDNFYDATLGRRHDASPSASGMNKILARDLKQ